MKSRCHWQSGATDDACAGVTMAQGSTVLAMVAALVVMAPAWAFEAAPVPRRVVVREQEFVVAATGAPIVMRGPNVVVKGPPYLPSTDGNTVCNDVVDATCSALGNCTSCYTFNQVRDWAAMAAALIRARPLRVG